MNRRGVYMFFMTIIIIALIFVVSILLTGFFFGKDNSSIKSSHNNTDLFINNSNMVIVKPDVYGFSRSGDMKFGIVKAEFKQPILEIYNLSESAIFKVYSNGTIWIKEGQENESAKQLVKFGEAFGGYWKQYCWEMLKP